MKSAERTIPREQRHRMVNGTTMCNSFTSMRDDSLCSKTLSRAFVFQNQKHLKSQFSVFVTKRKHIWLDDLNCAHYESTEICESTRVQYLDQLRQWTNTQANSYVLLHSNKQQKQSWELCVNFHTAGSFPASTITISDHFSRDCLVRQNSEMNVIQRAQLHEQLESCQSIN